MTEQNYTRELQHYVEKLKIAPIPEGMELFVPALIICLTDSQKYENSYKAGLPKREQQDVERAANIIREELALKGDIRQLRKSGIYDQDITHSLDL